MSLHQNDMRQQEIRKFDHDFGNMVNDIPQGSHGLGSSCISHTLFVMRCV